MGLVDVGGNIRRYMKIKKLSIKKLAEMSDIGTATISNVLNGKNTPNSTTLLKIADALEISLNDVLVDSPRLMAYRFRTNTSLKAREIAGQNQLLADCAVWLKNYQELEELTGESMECLLPVQNGVPVVETAVHVRELMGLKDPMEPVCDIVGLVEQLGIKIRIVSFGFKQTFGLSVSKADGGPAIFVNAFPGITIERQIFTIAHELGHLVLHIASYDGICSNENPLEETQANEFAAQLLMPSQCFLKKWEEYRGGSFVDTVLRVKRFFSVSYQTVLHRYSELHPGHAYSDLLMNFSLYYRSQYNHDVKNHYEPDAITSLVGLGPDRYSRLVRKAYEQNKISLSRAAELMRIPLMQMKDMASTWRF